MCNKVYTEMKINYFILTDKSLIHNYYVVIYSKHISKQN